LKQSKGSTFMQLNDVREWKSQPWTRLYEAALFERDTVKLCACLWDAQLAILSREQEIQGEPFADLKEQFALRKAMQILLDQRRLAGFDQEAQPHRFITAVPAVHLRRPRMRSRRSTTKRAA
jgi:hypothetical protein